MVGEEGKDEWGEEEGVDRDAMSAPAK